MDVEAMRTVRARQSGVISRRQVLACGATDSDLARLTRRHLLHRAMAGVYVEHNGPLSWEQQAWVVVLHYWPAALAGVSALVAHGLKPPHFVRGPRATVPSASGAATATGTGRSLGVGPSAGAGAAAGTREVFEVAVDGRRSPDLLAGVRLRRMADFDAQALMHLSPPRLRLERAVLEVAARARDESAAVGVLADAVQTRRTTALRLLDAIESAPRLARRRVLLHLLHDVASGAFSALEHRYLIDVERRHGLPAAARQRRERLAGNVVFRDVDYRDYGLIVELDGRLGHEWFLDAAEDLDRDVEALVEQRVTLRARWHQVLDPCRLAAAVTRLLWARGWTGVPRACGSACAVREVLLTQGPPIIVGSPAESA